MLTNEQIYTLIDQAIIELYRVDGELIRDETHEQSVSARLMCYIQCLFPEWNVDVEFNREGAYRDGRHRASKTDFEGIIRKPDIIIHKRGPQGPNLALILIKGYWNTDSCQNDREVALSLKQKLHYQIAYTLKLNETAHDLQEVTL